jgi:EpsI family protein
VKRLSESVRASATSVRLIEFVRTNWRQIAWWCLPIGAWLFCYATVFAALAGQWWSNDMYSYGFLIPVISLYLLWDRRGRLRQLPPATNYRWGGAVLVTGLLMYAVGAAGGVLLAQEISLIVTIAGGTLMLLGTRVFREVAFPIVYLLFMIPLWDVGIERLHFPFQVFSATLGVALLQSVGVPVHQDGVYIWLPNITLEVAKACSGVNYLIAVLAIGIPLAAIVLRGWKRRVLLVVFSLTVAALSNSLRVALIGVLAYNEISGVLHGPFHVLQGLFVSVVGYGAIFAGLWMLSQPAPAARQLGESADAAEIGPREPAARSRYAVIVFSVVLVVVGGYVHFSRPTPIPLKADFSEFPRDIGRWTGIDVSNYEHVYGKVGVDRKMLRSYKTESGQAVQLYIGYFESQAQGKELISYKSNDLFDGSRVIELGISGGRQLAVNERSSSVRDRERVTRFWYIINGRVAASQYVVKWYTAWDRLIHRRTNGAVIMVTAEVHGPNERDDAFDNTGEFISAIEPLVRRFVP